VRPSIAPDQLNALRRGERMMGLEPNDHLADESRLQIRL
jgi:hypothetical protein